MGDTWKRKKTAATVLLMLLVFLAAFANEAAAKDKIIRKVQCQELVQTIMGTLRQAERAQDAQAPSVFRMARAGSSYRTERYGDQLENAAAVTVYQSLVSFYVSQDADGTLMIRFPKPFRFSLSY